MAEAPPQGDKSDSDYGKQHPRINKPDMFIITALMMERSPQAQRPDSFVEPKSTMRDQSCSSQDESAGKKQDAHKTEDKKGTSDSEVQEDGQSKKEEPVVAKETVRRTEDEPRKCNKTGAVVVLPNDRALSVDCSQEGVHAAVSALNKFGQERAKGCQVYLSRRPCSYCAKLLVQCEMAKVYYLPIEPELNDKEDVQRVDKLFKASSTGLSVFIPKVSKTVIAGVKARNSPYLAADSVKPNEKEIEKCKDNLIKEYWSEEWISKASDNLEWPAFDENMKKQTKNDMENLMEWIARATVGDVPDRMFLKINPRTLQGVPLNKAYQGTDEDINSGRGPSEDGDQAQGGYKDASARNEPVIQETKGGQETREGQDQTQSGYKDASARNKPVTQESNPLAFEDSVSFSRIPIPFIPTPNEPRWQEHAIHNVRIAQMLSQRSDDPSKPVGCILMVHGEVVAIGWNGFPAKALYGEFPRASSTDQAREKKEPYVIHAEQNALLTRNKRNMKHDSSILYSNKIPCGECVPLLIQAGVKNVVVPCESELVNPENKAFFTALKKGKLKGFWQAKKQDEAASPKVSEY